MADAATQYVLSPSAAALLRAIRRMEHNSGPDQWGEAAEATEIRAHLSTFRGCLHDAVMERIGSVVGHGGVATITQQDVMAIVRAVWQEDAGRLSENDLQVLRAAVRAPGESVDQTARDAGLSYSKTRRSLNRLRISGVLREYGVLDCRPLGLVRVLVLAHSPEFVLAGPYVRKTLLVGDIHHSTLSVITLPSRRMPELLNAVRSLRNVASHVMAWQLGTGTLSFSGTYYNVRTHRWHPDLVHWRLLLRGGGSDLVVASPVPGADDRVPLSKRACSIIDLLQEEPGMSVARLAEMTSVSPSMASRTRALIMGRRCVIPRGDVRHWQLTETIVGVLPAQHAGELLQAWRVLPLSFVSQAVGVEDSRDRTVVLLARVPAGMTRDLSATLVSESPHIKWYILGQVQAAVVQPIRVSQLYDHYSHQWRWNVGLLDAQPLISVFGHAEDVPPVDLA